MFNWTPMQNIDKQFGRHIQKFMQNKGGDHKKENRFSLAKKCL